MAIMLKADVINRAYKKLRISGITSIPTSDDNELGLETLESLAYELEDVWNICLGYNFEDDPDINAATKIQLKNKDALSTVLADRLSIDFGKAMDPVKVNAAWSILSSSTAQARMTQYPSRQPIGRGNERRGQGFNKYYVPQSQAPTSSATNDMFIGDINTYVEHFDDYLLDTEDISTYTIEASDGITASSDSNATPDINYTITAVTAGLQQVQIQITTTDSRKQTRIINFNVTDPDGAI